MKFILLNSFDKIDIGIYWMLFKFKLISLAFNVNEFFKLVTFVKGQNTLYIQITLIFVNKFIEILINIMQFKMKVYI